MANMYGSSSQHVGLPQKPYGQLHYFQILSIFSYDILLAGQQADTAYQHNMFSTFIKLNDYINASYTVLQKLQHLSNKSSHHSITP